MAEPFLSEIRVMSFNFPPRGWAFCNGQILPINQNQALFSLLGTTYGGNGLTNFALPDLQGRVPLHRGAGHTLGETAGEYAHTLTTAELPPHTHVLTACSQGGNLPTPAGNVLASTAPNPLYGPAKGQVALAAGTVAGTGGSQAHANTQPFLALSFCIALVGIFPSQN
jgi:microcystin-dependent protein